MSRIRYEIREDLEAEKAHDANRREPVAPKDPAPPGADLPESLALAGALGDPLPHPEACRGKFPRPGCGLCAWLVSKGMTVLE